MTAGRPAPRTQGPLFLIGGGEDRKGDPAILRRVAEAARGRGVVVITTASDYPVELGKDYLRAFRALGVEEPRILDIRRREETDSAGPRQIVEEAGAVFFTGGRSGPACPDLPGDTPPEGDPAPAPRRDGCGRDQRGGRGFRIRHYF